MLALQHRDARFGLFRALSDLFSVLHRLFRALGGLFRALGGLFRALHGLFGAFRGLLCALHRLFRILRRLDGTLCGLFGTLISLLGASRGRGKVLLCLPQLGGERRATQRFCVDVAAIDIEAWGQRRRFAIGRHADQIRCARQSDAGLEMRVATPIEHQRRRSRYGLSEQRRSDQRPAAA